MAIARLRRAKTIVVILTPPFRKRGSEGETSIRKRPKELVDVCHSDFPILSIASARDHQV